MAPESMSTKKPGFKNETPHCVIEGNRNISSYNRSTTYKIDVSFIGFQRFDFFVGREHFVSRCGDPISKKKDFKSWITIKEIKNETNRQKVSF